MTGDVVTSRTYIDEECAWKNGNTNISIGRSERLSEVDGRWFFQWQLSRSFIAGAEDLSGDWLDQPDYGPPPGFPPPDASTIDTASARWGLADDQGAR